MSVSPTGRMGEPRSVLASLGMFLGISALAGVVTAGLALPFVGSAGVVSRNAVENFQSLPATLEVPPLPQQSVVLASDGSVIARLFFQNRVEVPLARISPRMQEAIVAIEDSRFYDHRGIDLRGTLRALASNSGGRGGVQGGSTLTQQYVKNVLVSSAQTEREAADARSRTLSRKLKELRYALVLEQQLSKKQILERYLNIAYFGAGSYGVEAAARRYFSTSAAKLTLAQAATLAGLVQQPVGYNPLRNPRGAQIRRDMVLHRMVETGMITEAQSAAAAAQPVASILKPQPTPPNGCTTSWAPFFCDYVLRVIRSDPAFGATPEARDSLLRSGGLTIHTTLNPLAQKSANASIAAHLPNADPSGKATAVSMVAPKSGAILAMTQNRTWGITGVGRTTFNYNVDRAHGGTIGMQAGSTFKVFTLAAALEQGVNPSESIDAPQEGTFDGLTNCSTGAAFPPYHARNSTGSGVFDMYAGTAYSVNTYFLALEQRTGLCRPIDIATRLGVTLATGKPLQAVPSQVLGTNEITPLAMAGAYAAIANHGVFCQPVAITSVTDRHGAPLSVPKADCHVVLDRGIADAVAALLVGVIDGPLPGRTGEAMSLGRPAAGKTGTTNDSAAVWFTGFTPDVATAVWVGDPRGGFGHPMKNVTINGVYYDQVFGSSLPGPIWRDTLLAFLANTPPTPFELFPAQGVQQGGGAPPDTGSPSPTDTGSSAPSDTTSAPVPTTSDPGPSPTTTEPQPSHSTSKAPSPTTSEPSSTSAPPTSAPPTSTGPSST